MVHAARALGLGVMLGCMVESGLGIAAGAQIASLMRPRRPRRQPAARARPVARRRIRRRRPAPVRRARASASSPRRLLILAEGHSGDPHYGKTARGVMRYRPEQRRRDPRLGAARARREDGFPIVGTVDEALRFEPTAALVGVATQGGRFPPAWRELLKGCIAAGLDIENGLHEFVSDDPELVELARGTASSCATCASRRPG